MCGFYVHLSHNQVCVTYAFVCAVRCVCAMRCACVCLRSACTHVFALLDDGGLDPEVVDEREGLGAGEQGAPHLEAHRRVRAPEGRVGEQDPLLREEEELLEMGLEMGSR